MKRTFYMILFLVYFKAGQIIAQAPPPDSSQTISKSWKLQRIWVGYAGENIIRPGMQFSADFIPVLNNKNELLISPTAAFFVFRPFYTSVMIGARATYHIHFPSGITLCLIGLGFSYKHTFLLAPAYEEKSGSVEEINDLGYGNIHALATTGFAYNFSDRTSVPFSVFTDFGFSAEPLLSMSKRHIHLCLKKH